MGVRRRALVGVLAVGAWLATPMPAYAATSTWDGGAGDGLWSSAANWSGDVLPTASSSVVIALSGAVVTLDTDFTLASDGALRIGFGTTLRVASGHSFTFESTDQLANNIDRGGTLHNDGTLRVKTRLNVGGRLENAAGATLEVGEGTTAFGNLFVSGLPADENVVNDGTVNFRGSMDLRAIFRNRATFNLLRGSIRIAGLANAGTFHNTTTGTLVGSSGTAIQVGDSAFTSTDTMVNDGAVTFPAALTVNRTMTNNGTFNNTGGSTTILCGADIRGTGTFTPGTLSEGCKSWTGGGGDGLWSNPLNWSLHTLPDGTKDVRIDGSAAATAVTLDTNFSLGASRKLDLTGPSTLNPWSNTLTIPAGRTLTLGSGATLTNNYSHIVNNGTVVNGGTLKNQGHPNINVARFDNAGTITNDGTLTNAGSPFDSSTFVEQYGIFTNTGSIANPGTIRNINGTWNNRGLIDGAGVINNDSIFNEDCGSLITGTQPSAGSNVVVTLCTPQNVAPAANATLDTAQPTFTWANASERRAVTYEWQLLDAAGTNVLATGASPTTSFAPSAAIADGAYRWRARALLGTAATTSSATPFTIDTNEPPVIDMLTLPATVAEGSSFDLRAEFHDPDAGDVVSVRIVWGDGNSETVPAATSPLVRSHIYADGPASRSVEVTATDGAGEAVSMTSPISVTNVAPVVDAGADASLVEGGTFARGGSFTDPGADTWLATVDYGDGGGAQPLPLGPSKTFTLAHVYADDGLFTVRVCVSDDDGALGCADVHVNVSNAAPVVDAGADQSGAEGAVIALASATFNDKGTLDTHIATIDWGDGTMADVGSVTESPFGPPGATTGANGTVSGAHVYADDGTYTVKVCVADDDGGVGCDTYVVHVGNLAPSATPAAPQTVDEGSTLALTVATFHDQGTADTHTATISWGDGTSTDAGAVTESPFGPPGATTGANGSVAGSHVYADNGTYAVTICVSDDDTATTCPTRFLTTVRNVPPTATLQGGPVTAYWGRPMDFAADITDPSPPDTAAGFDNRWNWGDGTANTTDHSLMPARATHTYQNAGPYTLTFDATDKDGGNDARSKDTKAITIIRRPSMISCAAANATFGYTSGLSAQLVDPVHAPTARFGGRTLTFTTEEYTWTATTDAAGRATSQTPTQSRTTAGPPPLGPGSHTITVVFATDANYDGSSATCTFTVSSNTLGTVQAETKQKTGTDPNGNQLHINVKNTTTGITGNVTFRDSAFQSRTITAVGIAPDGLSAWVSGVGADGRSFVIYAVEGNLAQIWIARTLMNGDGVATNGQVHISISR